MTWKRALLATRQHLLAPSQKGRYGSGYRSAFDTLGTRLSKGTVMCVFRHQGGGNGMWGGNAVCRRMSTSSSTDNNGGPPSSSPGEIFIYNEQDALQDLDVTQLEETISQIRSQLGYVNYGVTLVLVNDDEMQQTNLETRGVDGPTDILSFPMHPHVTPGVITKPEFENIPDLYTLGDLMLDVPYVMRRCQADLESLDEEEKERGVSGAMAQVYDPQVRIHMLLIHGMLHLVGYDHIEDEDYELMVTREEELLRKLGLPT